MARRWRLGESREELLREITRLKREKAAVERERDRLRDELEAAHRATKHRLWAGVLRRRVDTERDGIDAHARDVAGGEHECGPLGAMRAGAFVVPLLDDDMGGLVAEDLREYGVGGG